MSKSFVQYIMSFTRDGTYWAESQYARDVEDESEYKELIKMAKKKIKKDGVLRVKIDKITREEVFRMDKEDK